MILSFIFQAMRIHHNMLVFILSCIILTPMITSCGGKTAGQKHLLSVADEIMSCNPDSSLTILDAIDTISLSENDKAYYALLLTKARNKNYLFDEDDSLIRRAYTHYENSGDSLAVQSEYYMGEFLSRAQRWDEALFVLTESYHKAVRLEDWFYAGMNARELSHVNKMIMYPADELKWARTAKEMFVKSGHPVHAAWMDPNIAAALVYNGEYLEALDLINAVDSTFYHTNRQFSNLVIRQKINVYMHLRRYHEVIAEYLSLIHI